MKEKIFLKVDKKYDSDLIVGSDDLFPRRTHLKQYDRDEFLKEDLEVIESHQTEETVDMIGDERNEMDELAWDELAEITGQEISSSNPGTWFLDDVIEE